MPFTNFSFALGHNNPIKVLFWEYSFLARDFWYAPTVKDKIIVLFGRRGWWWVDPVLTFVIAVLIVRVAYQILSSAVPVLVDQRAIFAGDIQRAAEAVDGVKGAYGIRSRDGAAARYAEVTIAVDKDANVAAAHAIADEVEERLKRDLQLDEVTVHVEPC